MELQEQEKHILHAILLNYSFNHITIIQLLLLHIKMFHLILEKNQVDFIRIGGKPRTENKYILSHQLNREIPSEIQSIKRQIIYLISMSVLMNDCLKELESKSFKKRSESIIIEIDKVVNIRKFLFNIFPFYTDKEEIIISNFFDPFDLIPSAVTYFNCWVLGKKYYEHIKIQCQQNLQQKIDNLLNEMISYLNRKNKYEEPTEIIELLISKHFNNDEESFSQFVSDKKAKILSKDKTILFSIILEKEFCFLFESIDSIEPNVEMADDIQQTMTDNFNQLLSSENKLDSIKKYLKEMKELIIKEEKKLEKINEQKIETFEKIEIKNLGYELSKKKLIAMTATRATQYKTSLDLSNCQFMIIEETGELTESMAFSIIPKTIKNLVMIGDYRQLRPTVEYKLTFSPYNHHISLFEKEVIHSKRIKSDNIFTLSIQRRMHTEISSLL